MCSKSYILQWRILNNEHRDIGEGTGVFNMIFLEAYCVSSVSRAHCTIVFINTDLCTVSVFPSVTLIDSLLSFSANHTHSI